MFKIEVVFFVILCYSTVKNHASISQEPGKPCTYFGGTRVSSSEGNLVNCSWYAPNACCKRTEVTSVFGGMYPLFGASKQCSNHINYLMCYFCSPDQYKWYMRKAHVCREYCTALYDNCKTALYKGTAIGDYYSSGDEFCHGQKFEVVEGKDNCFDFDPDVFGSANVPRICTLVTIAAFLSTVLLVNHIAPVSVAVRSSHCLTSRAS